MANERENLNHLRSSVPFKKQTPVIDSGFSSKYLIAKLKHKKTINVLVFFSSFTISYNYITFTNEFYSTIN